MEKPCRKKQLMLSSWESGEFPKPASYICHPGGMGSRKCAPEIDKVSNDPAKAEEILCIQAQFPRRNKVMHDAAKVGRSKVKPHVIPGEKFPESLENLWMEETGDKGPEERFLLPDFPQRVLPKGTHNTHPVSKVHHMAFERNTPATAFFPGNVVETDNFCK